MKLGQIDQFHTWICDHFRPKNYIKYAVLSHKIYFKGLKIGSNNVYVPSIQQVEKN